ncbi:uroporphyrinogen-III synthase [Oleiagrimonas sp.]|uniref:uroporphyrinogen-III synthase n=1 Tax=Oleiagrimonas sp. TaxID=2010330 RepID=UPI00260A025F|nr:uroporphyrinogen-III synthase [Oleiagrimonas sp.]MDA3913343.1 uroporphyrinogen-III synthase [Oleiagrimonas sp.]
MTHDKPLRGADVLVTRPAGTGQEMVRKVRAMGGRAHLLPGLSLRPLPVETARRELQAVLSDEVIIFTSPAAVRFAARLAPLETSARVLGVGRGTVSALARAGLNHARAPTRAHEHSEGLLEHPWLQGIRGQQIALVTAPGGRGLLETALRERGARVHRALVYQRTRPRLTHRHFQMLARLGDDAWLLLTSSQALEYLLEVLPPAAHERLRACSVVVSSARLEAKVKQSGFDCVRVSVSPRADDLLVVVAMARAGS